MGDGAEPSLEGALDDGRTAGGGEGGARRDEGRDRVLEKEVGKLHDAKVASESRAIERLEAM